MNRNERLHQVAARLDRLREVPTEVLAEIVRRHDTCLWTHKPEDPPEPTSYDTADRELAAHMCAECPAHDECLELEFRLAGAETFGVYGGMTEQDRRDLYPIWRARRDNQGEGDAR